MRSNFPALCDLASVLISRRKHRYVLIEDASTGSPLADELKGRRTVIQLIKPQQDKRVRLFTQQALFSAGPRLVSASGSMAAGFP